MKTSPLLTTLPRGEQGGAQMKSLLHKDGYVCVLITLSSPDTLAFGAELTRQDHILFVVEGALQVEMDGITSLLNAHDALHVPRGKNVTLKNLDVERSKLLRVDVPPPPERAPLYTFPSEA